ncbi:B3 domain-containing protein Os12g0592300 [Striga asiatica]|uniref:B3 domain-containing protein Os12g0592300 n=1 Tax=Striga asiatica TaxID=4170 RepID=A0A5A7PF93_STRAF|nr:B3 domain-containing protein Os12g0592300 [Striga asiatica]
MSDFQEATPASSSKRRRKEVIKSPGNPVDDTIFFHRTKLTTLFKINKDLTLSQRRNLDKVVFVGHVARSFPLVGKQLHTGSPFLEQWSQQEISREIDVFKHMGGFDANFIWKFNEQSGGLKMDESVSKESVQRDSTTDPIVRDDLIDHLTLVNQGVSGIISLLKCNRDTPVNCGQDDNRMGTKNGKDPMTGQKKIASENGKDRMTGQNVACENGKNRMTGQKGASEESFNETMKPTKLDFDVCSLDIYTPARSCNTGKYIFQYFKEITIMDTNASEYVFNRDGDVSAEMLTIEYPHWLLSPVIDMVALHVTLNRTEEYSSKRNWVLPPSFSGMALSLHKDALIQKRFFRDRVFNGRADECLSITLTISDGNIHWYMCIVDMKRSVILIRDTLRSEVTNKWRIELAKKVGIISAWDGDGFIHENIANTFKPIIDPIVPQQPNGGGNGVSNGQSYDSCTVTMDTLYRLLWFVGNPPSEDAEALYYGYQPDSDDSSYDIPITTTDELRNHVSSYVPIGRVIIHIEVVWVQGYKECYCRQLAVIRTSWTSENPRRRFSFCKLYKEGGCNFFSWIDGPMCNRSKQLINGLLQKSNELRDRVQQLQDENDKMKEEKGLLEIKYNNLQKAHQTRGNTTMFLLFAVVCIVLCCFCYDNGQTEFSGEERSIVPRMSMDISEVNTFIKIIHPEVQHVLFIPDKIAANFDGYLPLYCTFHSDEIDSGPKWDMKVEQIGDRIGLTEGWVDFSIQNDIKWADFLAFKLVKPNNFVFYHFDHYWTQKNQPIPPMIWSTVEPLLPIECTLQNSEGDDAFKWPVVIKRLGTKIGFADGWEDFSRENYVKANHILLFELGGPNRALRSVVGSCIQDDEELDEMEKEAIVGGFHIQASFTLVSRGRQTIPSAYWNQELMGKYDEVESARIRHGGKQ